MPDSQMLCQRGIDAAKKANTKYMRPEHEAWLLHCAILSGHAPTIEKTAESVRLLDGSINAGRFYPAWTGVVKYYVLGEIQNAETQLELLKSEKPDRVVPWPGLKLLRNLIQKDFKAVNKQCALAMQKYSDALQKQKAIFKEDSNRRFLIPRICIIDFSGHGPREW